MIPYNFCPNCGTQLDAALKPPHCDRCGMTYYQSAKPTASVLPIKDGKVLLSIRGREPYKGAYEVIGGFLEADETPEDGALREAKEETALNMKIVSLLGVYVDRYGEDGHYTLNFHYIAEVVSGEMRAQDDAAALRWVEIDELPPDVAFQNNRDSLRDLQKWYKKTQR
jgi:ADP-ribose pyrophosphatase YjhB (NUDIX family)